jgi:dihydrofolate reductase
LDQQEIFIMGGSFFYTQAMKYVIRLYLTIVDGNYETEEIFPRYDAFTKILLKEKGMSGKYSYTFTILEKG